MRKKLLATTAAGLCAMLVYIGIAMLTAPAMVDGVTAATTNNTVKFIQPIAVTSTTATVTWTSQHTDGNAVFTYNGTAITLTAAQRTARSLSLTGLTPSTLYNIKLACTKSGETEADATGTFTTLGNSTNQPPVITSATAVSCTTNTTITYTVTATDPDGDPITFTSGTLPAWITFASPTLTLKPVSGSANTSVTITASDGKGGLDTLNLAVSVVQLNVNAPPVITSPASVACTTNKAKTYIATATDANNDPVTFTYSGLPAWMNASGATLTMNATPGSVNSTVRIVASDGKGGLDTLDLGITVYHAVANLPPAITSPAAVICTTGNAATYTATATDPNGDAITFTYLGLPSWISASGATLTLNPTPANANSSTTIRLIAANGKGGSDTLDLSITVAKITGIIQTESSAGGRFIAIGRTQIAIPDDERTVNVTLFRCSGTLVMKRSIDVGSSGAISLQDINPGVYLVSIKTKASTIAKKIIIER